jgi:hypothetical protein
LDNTRFGSELLLGFIFEPRAFAASVAFDFVFDFKTIPKGALSRYCFKGSLARRQFVEQASLPSRLTLVLIQIHYNTVLMDLLSVVNLSKELSLLDERLRIHSSKLNLTTIVGGSTHAYNLNKRFIRTRVAVAWDTLYGAMDWNATWPLTFCCEQRRGRHKLPFQHFQSG